MGLPFECSRAAGESAKNNNLENTGPEKPKAEESVGAGLGVPPEPPTLYLLNPYSVYTVPADPLHRRAALSRTEIAQILQGHFNAHTP